MNQAESEQPVPVPSGRAVVCLAMNAVAHYREHFLNLLKSRLHTEGIELLFIHGTHYRGHNIGGSVEWATPARLRSWGSLTWLSVLKPTRGADLVIVPQVLKHLWIYPLLFRHLLGIQKIALWGHGKVFSARREDRLATRLKNTVSRWCDWWFAYTEGTARIVRDEIGFDPARITVVNNAVDTRALSEAKARLDPVVLDSLRRELGIESSNIGIFVGGMYHSHHHSKRLTFLVEACIEVRRIVPDFHMIFLGGGPEQHVVEIAAAEHPWIHYPGIRKGTEAVPYWALARICLNPGLVGLGILDCLALGVPMLTSNVSYHSPEIEYLEHEVNGIIIDDRNDPAVFARAAAGLMADPSRIDTLASNGRITASQITNESMVDRFTDGILRVLNLDPIHP
jgi:glycosyltransferase involved in cell wall biosynthesis